MKRKLQDTLDNEIEKACMKAVYGEAQLIVCHPMTWMKLILEILPDRISIDGTSVKYKEIPVCRSDDAQQGEFKVY